MRSYSPDGLSGYAVSPGKRPHWNLWTQFTGIGMRRLVVLALMIALTFAVTTSSALAHGDVGLGNELVTLDPGESSEFSGDLHYHRLVGRVSADGPVIVRLVDSRTGEIVVSYGPDTSMSFNELIRCCDDAGWAPHELILDNAGTTSTTVDLTARLVHDDLAVMVYGAEGGTRESVAVFGVIWAAVVWRVTRRRKPPISLNRALGVTAGLVSAVGAMSILGLVRYGVGGPPALLAGLSEVSVIPFNPAVSGVSISIAILVFLWGLACVWWIRARPLSDRAQWLALGLVLASLVVVTGFLVGRTYGGVGIPIASTLVAVAPLLVVLWNELVMKQDDLRQPEHPGKPGGQPAF